MILEYLQRVCCFLVIAEVLLKLNPSKKYERYLKMVMGFITLAIVLVPICRFVAGEERMLSMETLPAFEQKLEQVMKEGERQMRTEMEGERKEQKIDEIDITISIE